MSFHLMQRLRTLSVLNIVIFVTSAVVASDSELAWSRDIAYDGLLPKGADVTSPLQEMTKVQCATRCALQKWCNNFLYNSDSRLCSLQRVVYKASQTVSAPGWQLYKLASAGPQYATDRETGWSFRVELQTFLKWTEARDCCLQHGETLAVLEPLGKARFIDDFLNANTKLGAANDLYIGAARLGKTCPFPASGPDIDWVDGTPMDFNATRPFWGLDASEMLECRSTKKAVILRKKGSWSWSQAFHRSMYQQCLCQRPFPPE